MHPFFIVQSSEIRNLNDEQARELVAQLCKAELSKNAISTSAVSWGGNQLAKDGGFDVSVEVKVAVSLVNYIPKADTGFQVKAEKFPPSKIPKEMAPNGALRQSISQLIDKSGAYIIVSTKDSCTYLALEDRKKAMAESLESHPSSSKIHLDFFDSQKMADWANNYPGIVVWIKDCLGGALQSWQPYGPWAYKENDVASEYLIDNKIKVQTPTNDSGLTIIEAIDNIRRSLSIKGASARIVGLSGVGKTRLVQALFDDRISTVSKPLASDSVIYADLANGPSPLPNALLEALIISDSDCVVVIDNCGQDVHQILTQIVKRPDSKLKLITVEYDIRDHQPEGTDCYHLEGSSNDVIAQLLIRHFNKLSELDINKIVDFADGNARVAFALASTSEEKGQLAKLQDEELFKRLFLQKQYENNELQRCAEAASLIYSFDVDNLEADSELSLLAELAEVTATTFYRNIVELQRRGLIQARGQWRAVLPHAIANRLALDAVQQIPSSILTKSFITQATERVARSFSRRLGYLHESTNAQKIVSELLEPDGYLNDVAKLDLLKWEILENLSPVNQKAALNAILRLVEKNQHFSMPNFISATKILRSLAYEENLFEKAAHGLLQFSIVEPLNDKADKSLKRLESLFYLNLSGTLATPLQRADFIKKLVFHSDIRYVEVGLELLKAALSTNYPSEVFNYDFGALKRTYGWAPQSSKDVKEWYSIFIGIAIEIGKTDTEIGTKGRRILGEAFRGLWSYVHMEDQLIFAANEFIKTTEWLRGWIGLRSVLQYDSKGITNESMNKLKSLEKLIEPKDIKSKIQAKVLSQRAYSIDLSDNEHLSVSEKYQRAYEEAQELGKVSAHDEVLIDDLHPFVQWENSSSNLNGFGIGLGETSNNVEAILNRLEQYYEPPLKPGLDFNFLTGLINGWYRSKPEEVELWLDKALENTTWGPLFLILQLANTLNERGLQRVLKSLDLGLVPTKSYSNLGNGRSLDNLSVHQIAALLKRIGIQDSKGLEAAIDILHMVMLCSTTSPPKSEEYQEELAAAYFELFCEFDWAHLDHSNENLLNDLEAVFEFCLKRSKPERLLKILDLIVKAELKRVPYPNRIGLLLVPFLKQSPKETLDLIFEEKDKSKLYRILTLSLGRSDQYATYAVSETALIEWCRVSPAERFIFAATTCILFEKDRPLEEYDEEKGITNIAIELFKLAPNKVDILKIFMYRFVPYSWSGSRSAIMTHRLGQLDRLNPGKDNSIQLILDAEKPAFITQIEREVLSEQSREQPRLDRFE